MEVLGNEHPLHDQMESTRNLRSIESVFIRPIPEIIRAFGSVGVLDCAAPSLILLTLLTWGWLWAFRRGKYRRFTKGPMQLPLVGCALDALRHLDHIYDWLLIYFSDETKTLHLRSYECTYHCTVDPELVEHILKTNFSNYPKGRNFYHRMKILLGNGIFNSDGEIWRTQRKTASYQFSSKVLRDFSTNVFRERALKLVDIVSCASKAGEPIEMQDLFLRLTLDSIFKVGFGLDLGVLETGSLNDIPFARAFDTANKAVARRFLDIFWMLKRRWNLGQEKSLKESIKELDDFVYRAIRTRRSELHSARASGNPDIRPDILSTFMELAEDPTSNKINDKMLRDIVVNFMVAGRDTTAVTLSWFTYMMALNPDIAEKVFEELKQFELNLKDNVNESTGTDHQNFSESIEKFARLLNYVSLANLTYLHAALTETLRLYPAVPADPKGIFADDIAPNGSKLKRGDFVIYMPYCMGRMEFIWGQDAHQFKPERWIKDEVFQPASPFTFTAFQAGPRICLGKDSAYLQMKMTAALLCRFFKFKLVPRHKVKYAVSMVLTMAHGLKVTVTKRS